VSKFGFERRSSRRFRCTGEASIFVISSGVNLAGRIADLSMSGCQVYVDRPGFLKEYDKIEVAFNIDRLFVRVRGYVRNVRPDHSVGIEFNSVSERTKQRLEELVEELKDRAEKAKNASEAKSASEIDRVG
jgi:PilZ domain